MQPSAEGSGYGTFVSGGSPVDVLPGDVIRGANPRGVKLTIPNLTLAFDTALDTVAGRCFASQRYRLDVNPGGGSVIRNAGTDGRFSLDLGDLADPIDLASGTMLRITCESRAGDRVRGNQSVP
jgi:hypothetical protein